MSTPAERRERRKRRRSIGWIAIAVAVVATLVGVFALFIQTQVTVIGGGNYFCGGVIDGIQLSGLGGAVCAEALSGYVVASGLCAVAAVAGFAVGGVILARTR